jgi:hypothetical protein
MGVVGIYIHGLKNFDGYVAKKGKNPFDYIDYGNTGKKLSSIAECVAILPLWITTSACRNAARGSCPTS